MHWCGACLTPAGWVQVAAQAGQRAFHVIISAAGPAVHWQSRICHFQYKRVKAACEAAGKCEMGGFTRLLHEGVPDDLMQEIPTFVADPLPADQAPDDGCENPSRSAVSSRLSWTRAGSNQWIHHWRPARSEILEMPRKLCAEYCKRMIGDVSCAAGTLAMLCSLSSLV